MRRLGLIAMIGLLAVGCASSLTNRGDACVTFLRLESVTPVETTAALRSDLAPIAYPDLADRAGVAGVVQVKFVVEVDGSADSVYVWRGIGAGCDEAAHSAIKNGSFLPAKSADGEAVRSNVHAYFRFSLAMLPVANGMTILHTT